jgi:hypothetical protein
MKAQLLTVSLLALAVQGVSFANDQSVADRDADSSTHEISSRDEIWGIGRRTVEPHSSAASAVQATLRGSQADSLEAAFWFCDYIAGTRGVDATPIAMCSAAYDELKTVKFGGDFSALLGWWKENKIDEHRKVASQRGEAAVQ